jgi:O-antigen/teichoic acid export membrane protein
LKAEAETQAELASRIDRLWGLARKLFGTRLYANAFYLWANTIVTSASTFIFWLVVARLYDTEDVGLAAAAISALILLGTASNLGLGFGLIRFLPEANERVVSLLNGSFMLGASAATVTTVIFLLGLPLWSPSLGFLRDKPLPIVLYTLFVVCVTLWMIQTQAFVALRRAEFALLGNVAGSVGKLVLPVALGALLAPFTIVGAWASAPVLSVAVVSLWLLRRAHANYRPAINIKRWPSSEVLGYSFGNQVSMLLLMTPGLLLPLMVVHQLGGETNAYFYIAWTMSAVLATASMSLSLSLFSEGAHHPQRLHEVPWFCWSLAIDCSWLLEATTRGKDRTS